MQTVGLPDATERAKFRYAALGVAALTLILYFIALRNDFSALDDPFLLLQNKKVLDFDILGIFLKDITRQRDYIPLTYFSFALENRLFGLNPLVFHLTNVLLHMANVLVVMLLAYRLSLRNLVVAT